MFQPVDTSLDLVALERDVLARWRDENVFAESLRRREGAPEWVFYEGPPTANGRPGIHHVWARLFKDIYPRFQTMRGRYVEDWQSLTSRIGMWIDTAGAYWTLTNEYVESVWWLFAQLWDGGHIYEG